MDTSNTFHYNYSATQNKEVLNIRKKYLPQPESKLDELKRLDQQVEAAGIAPALCVGIGNLLPFGLGLCMTLNTIPGGMVPGVLLVSLGTLGMCMAYPVYRKRLAKEKAKLTPRILELLQEIS